MIETLSLKALHAIQILLGFTYYYPLFMAYLWTIGALWFYLRYEFRQPKSVQLVAYPKVSIVVPCFNEEDHVREVIGHLVDCIISITRYSPSTTAAVTTLARYWTSWRTGILGYG